MNEYYAVQRSGSSISHYGVKGMKWGVRKAIARQDSQALDRHFRKAAKKLAKLQKIGLGPGKSAARSIAYGAAAAGTGTVAVKSAKLAGITFKKFVEKAPIDNKTIHVVGAAALTAGLAGKAIQNAYRSASSAKYRKKAVQYKNAMDEAFSGTKYSGKYVAEPRMKKRRKKG